jgi:hypothetical protein
MYKMKDAYGDTLLQFMDFKEGRTAKFRLSDLETIDNEELKRDAIAQLERIKKSPFYTGQYTKNYQDSFRRE